MTRVVLSDAFAERAIARRWAELTERACAHFRALHAADEGYDPTALNEAAREAVMAARRMGNDSEGGILDYLTLVYMLGRDFANDPQYATWIGPWMDYHRDSGERLKVEHIIAEALPFADDIEPAPAAWKQALATAEAGLDTLPPLLGGKLTLTQVVDACRALIAPAWPQRWEHLPPEQLPACLQAYNHAMGPLRLRTGGEMAAYTLLALRFGGAFCDDPRFPLFRAAANQGGDGRGRICALLRAAKVLASHTDKREGTPL